MSIHVETDRLAEIHQFLLYPGSSGSGLITPGGTPTTIYLDPEYVSDNREEIFIPGLSYQNDARLIDTFGFGRVQEARGRALEVAGTRACALFFEKVLQGVLEDDSVSLKHIMVGVTSFTGDCYHDLGYLASC